MRPLRLHLDTSDFSVMYRANPGTPESRTREWLQAASDKGNIQIGLSYHLFFELLQKAEPKFRDDRLARAQLLSRLCGKNAFPYPTDIGQGASFSNDRLWLPRIDLADLEIENVVKCVIEGIAHLPGLNRHERRILRKRAYFAQWLRDDPTQANKRVREVWPLKFGKGLLDNGDFTRYVTGGLGRSEINANVLRYVSDPISAYGIWFEDYGRGDPIAERRDGLVKAFVVMLEGLRKKLDGSSELQTEIKKALTADGEDGPSQEDRVALTKLMSEAKKFSADLTSPEELYAQSKPWRERFGDDSAMVAVQILFAFHKEKRPIKRSDGIDIVHAMYLPHADLWRGDKAFSDLLIKHRVNYSDRIVSSLAELPPRIERELGCAFEKAS